MKLLEYYKYSWFSNLSYVLWTSENIGAESSPENRVAAAVLAERAPERLGNAIFSILMWCPQGQLAGERKE